MAARRRRGPSAPTARVALVVALNALALVALWQVWPRSAAAEAADSPPAPASVSAPAATAAVAARPPSLPAAAQSRLERRLRAIVDEYVEKARRATANKVHAGNAAVAIHVRELGAGARGEVALGSDRLMRPASNLKLATTAAALALLGSDWRFETRFEARGTIVNGVLDGDLVVVGCGDPLYDPQANGAVEHLLEPAIAQLVASGLRAIRGDLVLDEGAFLEPGPAPEWPDAGQHWTEYCARSGALSANRGCLTARVAPTQPGELARVTILPREHGLPEQISARTSSKGPSKVLLGAIDGTLRVGGTHPGGQAPFVESFAHPDPVVLFGHALAGALARRGIAIEGRMRRERRVPRGEVVATLSTPLVRYLGPINRDSTNAVADQVFLATAAAMFGEGTRQAGERATRLALERLGVPTEGFVQVDGSGLSQANRITARQIVALIESVLARDRETARLYLASLAVAGESGTLADRMERSVARGRVRAKTGYIKGTSALSGVVDALDGRQFVFSCLVRYEDVGGLNPRIWKPMQDEICEVLVQATP